VQGFLFATRTEVETILLRTPGMLYQEVDNGSISNLYNYQIVNKSTETISDIEFRVANDVGIVRLVGEVQNVEKLETTKGSLFIEIKRENLSGRKTKIKIEVFSNGELIDKAKTNFLGPI
jgi:hypothetical protein